MELKLSDAIRLGSMMKPQGFGGYHDDSGGSCALGAAFDAIGENDCIAIESLVWPVIDSLNGIECPECGAEQFDSLRGPIIPHLNDIHRWTREQIADLVAQFEPSEIASPESVEQGVYEVS